MRVLITRPQPDADALAQLCGSQAIGHYVWPATLIQPVSEPDSVCLSMQEIQPGDLVIFISPNAVRQAMQLTTLDIRATLSVCQLFAVGPGTAKALAQYGFDQVIYPKGLANSESLIDLPELQSICAKTVWIMRGQVGRKLLANTLLNRGATVRHIACYQRQPNHNDIDQMMHAWREQPFDMVVSTSLSGLQYLYQAVPVGQKTWLHATRVTVTSQKMLTWARQQGIHKTIMLSDMRNQSIVTKLIELREFI